MRRGNCYYTSEALYHILGGKKAGWKPMRIPSKVKGRIGHWFIMHKSGLIIDASVRQFRSRPRYSKGIGCGFLTKKPSKHARDLIDRLTYFHETKT